MSHPSERRRLQRIELLEPLAGTIDGQRILILDVSRTGMRVAHQERIASDSDHHVIEFEWDGRLVALECRVTDSHLQRAGAASYARSIYHSGLTIVAKSQGSAGVLREMIEWHVRRALDEQKAGSSRVPAAERSKKK